MVSWGAGFLGSERAENDLVMGVLTSTGYLFIVLVLMIGISFNDTGKTTVSYHTLRMLSKDFVQLLLFNLFGFLFYISAGSSQVYIYRSDMRPTKVIL